MGRPREFDADNVLEKAMLAFWEKGLQRTSMRQIEELTGVKQVSLYNAFNDKEGLFLAAHERYIQHIGTALDRQLENRDLDGIVAFANSMVTPGSGFPDNPFGCLTVNTALIGEMGSLAIKERVDFCRVMVRDKLRAALERANARGKLKLSLRLDDCAELLVSTFWGIFITIRLAGDQSAGKPSVKALKRTLQDWCADANL